MLFDFSQPFEVSLIHNHQNNNHVSYYTFESIWYRGILDDPKSREDIFGYVRRLSNSPHTNGIISIIVNKIIVWDDILGFDADWLKHEIKFHLSYGNFKKLSDVD